MVLPSRTATACEVVQAGSQSATAFMPDNGLVERFNGRIANMLLGINVAGHADLEIFLAGFNRAYNRRRQRVLQSSSTRQKVNNESRGHPRSPILFKAHGASRSYDQSRRVPIFCR